MRDIKAHNLGLTDTSGYVGPTDPDVAIVIPGDGIDEMGGTPFVRIRQPTEKITLYADIVMCGYPAGDESLDIFRKHIGLRLSPIIQFGHLTGFMPTDDVQKPWGVQTDIVGTGGSSGSATIDLIDNSVVGIAQNVFAAGIKGYAQGIRTTNETSKEVEIIGKAIMGLI